MPEENNSDIKFQRYAHDKFFNSRQTDIEPETKPGLNILRSTQMKKIAEKLRKILTK
jgi:hypothetical protein